MKNVGQGKIGVSYLDFNGGGNTTSEKERREFLKMAALGVAGAMIPSQISASVEADTKTKDGMKAHRAPRGTALIVYVAEDGNIIEAIEPTGAAPQFDDKNMTDFARFKFRTGGQATVMANAAAAPTYTDRPSHELPIDDDLDGPAVVPCCWRMVSGVWICKPQYC